MRKTPELQQLMAEYNPRRISQAAKARLKKSLAAFGFLQPIVINTRTNKIIGGHQRLILAAEMQIPEVPTLEVDLDPEKEKMANVALNKIRGKWDAEKLEPIFELLASQAIDIETTGYDAAEVQETISLLHSGEHRPADFEQIVVKLNREDKKDVTAALRKAKAQGPFTQADNKNGNGNALERLCQTVQAEITAKPAKPAA